MAEDTSRAERALRALGRRYEHGLSRLHPLDKKTLAKVRALVRQQGVPTQSQDTITTPGPPPQDSARSQSRSKSDGHSHSH